MSAPKSLAGRGAPTSDPLLVRLPIAAWRALPALVLGGVGALLAGTGAVWALGPSSPWVPVLAGAAVAPLLAVAVSALQSALFVPTEAAPSWRRRILASEAAVVIPALAAGLGLLAGQVSGETGIPLFSVVGVAGLLAAAVVALVAAVALPVALRRGDVGLRSVVVAAGAAVIRRPLAALAALAATAAVAWLGLSWFAGVLALVLPVLAVLVVPASWTTVRPSGVDVPDTLPREQR